MKTKKPIKDALDKLIVNCNKLEIGKAKRILSSKKDKDLSLQDYKWDVPLDLKYLSSNDSNRHEVFIGVNRWVKDNEKSGNKFICIAHRGELIYLEPEIVRILYNSIKDKMQGTIF